MIYAPEAPDCETLRVPVIKVFDGDGFLTRIPIPHRGIGIETGVRLGFIDVPELEQPGGHEARDFLTEQINGRWVDLVVLIRRPAGRHSMSLRPSSRMLRIRSLGLGISCFQCRN